MDTHTTILHVGEPGLGHSFPMPDIGEVVVLDDIPQIPYSLEPRYLELVPIPVLNPSLYVNQTPFESIREHLPAPQAL